MNILLTIALAPVLFCVWVALRVILVMYDKKYNGGGIRDHADRRL